MVPDERHDEANSNDHHDVHILEHWVVYIGVITSEIWIYSHKKAKHENVNNFDNEESDSKFSHVRSMLLPVSILHYFLFIIQNKYLHHETDLTYLFDPFCFL